MVYHSCGWRVSIATASRQNCHSLIWVLACLISTRKRRAARLSSAAMGSVASCLRGAAKRLEVGRILAKESVVLKYSRDCRVCLSAFHLLSCTSSCFSKNWNLMREKTNANNSPRLKTHTLLSLHYLIGADRPSILKRLPAVIIWLCLANSFTCVLSQSAIKREMNNTGGTQMHKYYESIRQRMPVAIGTVC